MILYVITYNKGVILFIYRTHTSVRKYQRSKKCNGKHLYFYLLNFQTIFNDHIFTYNLTFLGPKVHFKSLVVGNGISK